MVREATVLDGLRDSAVPHPELIAACTDESVLGSSFYLMEPIDGFNPASALPAALRDDPAAMRELAFAMVDALVALAQVDVTKAPLTELGSKPGWIERQVPRWARRLDALERLHTYQPLPKARTEAVRAWLAGRLPNDERLGLVHGDFTFANVLVDHLRPELAAVVDWELASIGDPRLDVAHFVISLSMRRVPGLWDLEGIPGIPAPRDLIEAYASRTGTDIEDMRWFQILAGFRLLTLLEETVGRAAGGDASRKLATTFRRITEQLLDHVESLTLQRN
jgi:aminoglycoside phosphotransferase (APT) family kinase protein